MCGSSSKKQLTKADQVHNEEGGFHLVEVDSPVHISGTTWVIIILIGGIIAGAIYRCYRKDKKEERRYRAREETKFGALDTRNVPSNIVQIDPPRPALDPSLPLMLPIIDALRRNAEPVQRFCECRRPVDTNASFAPPQLSLQQLSQLSAALMPECTSTPIPSTPILRHSAHGRKRERRISFLTPPESPVFSRPTVTAAVQTEGGDKTDPEFRLDYLSEDAEIIDPVARHKEWRNAT